MTDQSVVRLKSSIDHLQKEVKGMSLDSKSRVSIEACSKLDFKVD